MSATAGWHLDRLVAALARAGWATLDGRQGGGPRAILRALADLLPHGSATGRVTAPQLAEASGLSEKWTRVVLARLEAAGIITWIRGGIVNGRPTASIVKVSKKALANLINRARPEHDKRVSRRAAATAERIRTTVTMNTIRRRRVDTVPSAKPTYLHAELSTALPPIGEVTRALRAPDVGLPASVTSGFRQQLRMRLAGVAA